MIEQIDTKTTTGSFEVTTESGSVYQVTAMSDSDGAAIISGGANDLRPLRCEVGNSMIRVGNRICFRHPTHGGHHTLTTFVTTIEPISGTASVS